MGDPELNEIIISRMHNVWSKQAYLKGFFSKFPTKRQINIFERMDIAESIYEGLSENFLKIADWPDPNRDDIRRKQIGETAFSKENLEKCGRSGKWKTRHADNMSDKPMGKHCMIHSGGHSSKEYKAFSDFGKKIFLNPEK